MEYQDMTVAQRKVAIAQDVIDAVKAEQFGRVSTGAYVKMPAWRARPVVLNRESAQEIMPECAVCARGAMMLVKLAKYNGNEFPGVYLSSADLARYATKVALADAFSRVELELIEAAFECSADYAVYAWSEAAHRAVQFGRRHIASSEDRLIAIMQNIIDHGGEFTP